MPPLVTIGIPTYNRPSFLRDSLASAIAQSYPNTEVVVSDNASDGDIETLVRDVSGNRVRYHRNSTNLGPLANFLKALDLANGEYFSWLQDDDLIFSDFISRGVDALETAGKTAMAYVAFAICSPTVGAVHHPILAGPPFPLDWVRCIPLAVPAVAVSALSLSCSVGMPPVALFRTEALRRKVQDWANPQLPLYIERTMLAAVATEGKVLAAGHIAGLLRTHDSQYQHSMLSSRAVREHQWNMMAIILEYFCPHLGNSREFVQNTLRSLPPLVFQSWWRESRRWPSNNSLASEVRDLFEQVAHESRTRLQPDSSRIKSILHSVAADWCPPVLLRSLKRLRGESG